MAAISGPARRAVIFVSAALILGVMPPRPLAQAHHRPNISNSTAETLEPHLMLTSAGDLWVTGSEWDGNDTEFYAWISSDGGITFAPRRRLTTDDLTSRCLDIAEAGRYVLEVFVNANRGADQGAQADVFTQRSTDGGKTFGPRTRHTNDAGLSGCPSPFIRRAGITNPMIVVARPGDLKPPVLTSARETEFVDNQRLYTTAIVVAETRDSLMAPAEIIARRSTDVGLTWEPLVNLSNTPALQSFDPKGAASGDRLYVGWTEEIEGGACCRIVLRTSADGGATWGPFQFVPSASGAHLQFLAAEGPYVYAVAGMTTIVSSDGGTTWQGAASARINPQMSLSTPCSQAHLTVSGSILYEFWFSWCGGGNSAKPAFGRSLTGGETWTWRPIPVREEADFSSGPGFAAAVAGTSLSVAWPAHIMPEEGPDASVIMVSRSVDGGSTWAWASKLREDGADPLNDPQLAAVGTDSQLIWEWRGDIFICTGC